MKNLKAALRKSTAAIAVATLSAGAQADLITQSRTFSTGGDISGAALTDSRLAGPGSELYDYFDPALGTLNAVTWQLIGAIASFDLDHRAQVTAPITFPLPSGVTSFTMDAKGEVQGHIGLGGLPGTGGQSFNLVAGAGAGCDLEGAPNPAFPPLPPPVLPLPGSPGCKVHTGNFNFVLFDFLSAATIPFLGVGQFAEFNDATLDWSTLVGVGGFGAPALPGPDPSDVSGAFNLNATLRLVYDFTPTPATPTPVPATALLFATGLAGLFLGRRRA